VSADIDTSEKLSWMNRLIMILESGFDPSNQQFLEQQPVNGDNNNINNSSRVISKKTTATEEE
jgi:hypothetical protein